MTDKLAKIALDLPVYKFITTITKSIMLPCPSKRENDDCAADATEGAYIHIFVFAIPICDFTLHSSDFVSRSDSCSSEDRRASSQISYNRLQIYYIAVSVEAARKKACEGRRKREAYNHIFVIAIPICDFARHSSDLCTRYDSCSSDDRRAS